MIRKFTFTLTTSLGVPVPLTNWAGGYSIGGWRAPKGYTNDKLQKIVVPNSDAKHIVKGFKECAKGVYHNEEIRKSLISEGFKCSKQQFSIILRNPFYAGKIRINPWKEEVEETVLGIHVPLITQELFSTVQEILQSKTRQGQKHTKRNPLMPLRGYMICDSCGGNLTGSGSRSRSKKLFYYYHCQKGCPERLQALKANDTFQAYLENFSISDEVGNLYLKVMEDLFNQDEGEMNKRIKSIDRQVDKLQDRVNQVEDKFYDGVIDHEAFDHAKKRYASQIDTLFAEQVEITRRETDFMKYVNYSFSLLLNLGEYYKRASVEVKQKLIGSIFPEKLIFDGKKYRTTNLNEVLDLLTLNINKLGEVSKRKADKNVGQSRWAPPPRPYLTARSDG